MTGILGCAAKAIAVGGLAASGALVAQDQFDNGSFSVVSRTPTSTDVGATIGGDPADAGANGSADAPTGAADVGLSADGSVATTVQESPASLNRGVAARASTDAAARAPADSTCGCLDSLDNSLGALRLDADAQADGSTGNSGWSANGLLSVSASSE